MPDRTIIIPEFEEYIAKHGSYYRLWTEDEEIILAAYYGKVPPARIAKKLNRSIRAIHEKARAMGIRAADAS
jgi:pyruvate/oxaloacetate carboxyltransferase